MSIDLHIHSTMSDGTLTPKEIVDLAYRKGLTAISLTDHDTVAGYVEAKTRGDEIGLEVISGVELSVRFENDHLHLLGYFVDCNNQVLLNGLRVLHEARMKRNSAILAKLADLGIVIQEKELANISKTGETGRPHIATILLQRGEVESMDQAFEQYLGRTGSAYESRFVYDLQQGIELIHGAGGLAVIAHPGNLLKDHVDESPVLKKLIHHAIDGVEVYYPTHSKQYRKQLLFLAKKYGLIVTGGSDYHGSVRKGTTLAGGKVVTVPAKILDDMRKRVSGNTINRNSLKEDNRGNVFNISR